MAEDVQRSAWKYWLASHKYWHTVTPSPPRSPPDVTVWSNMKMLMLMWEWQVMNECQNGTWPMTQCESVVCRIVDCQHRFKWCHLRTSFRLHASPSGATNITFLHVALPKTDKQTLMCKISAWYSFLLRGRVQKSSGELRQAPVWPTEWTSEVKMEILLNRLPEIFNGQRACRLTELQPVTVNVRLQRGFGLKLSCAILR